MQADMVAIASFLAPEDAEVARIALDEEGIASYLEGAATVGMVWYWSNAVGGVKLLVAAKDVQHAREVLADKRLASNDKATAVRLCPECGADITPDFQACWSCGKPVDDRLAPVAEADGKRKPDLEDESETAVGDAMAWRAFAASVIGIFLLPPIVTLYSGWTLIKLAVQGHSLSRKGSRHFWFALVINIVVCSCVGWFISILR